MLLMGGRGEAGRASEHASWLFPLLGPLLTLNHTYLTLVSGRLSSLLFLDK